jgi:hypothetical protein
MWTCVKPFIDKATQEKVVFENKAFSTTMLEMCDLDQVEKRFGGNAPNLERFWPPVFPNTPLEADSDIEIHDQRKKSVVEISSKSYKRHEDSEKHHIAINDMSCFSDAKSVDNEQSDLIVEHELQRMDKMDVQSCMNDEEYLEEEKETVVEIKAYEKKHRKKSKRKNKKKQYSEEIINLSEDLQL